MKGLLIKDLYMFWKYCKLYAAASVGLMVIALCSSDSTIVMPLMLTFLFMSMIPITLYSYDEREKGTVFTATFPVSRAKYVSEKYILGLMFNVLSLLIITTVLYFKMDNKYNFLVTAAMMFGFSFLVPSVLMPFMIKLGVYRGHILGAIFLGFMYALIMSTTIAVLETIDETQGIVFNGVDVKMIFYIVDIFVLVIYVLSWLLSIYLYQRKEL